MKTVQEIIVIMRRIFDEFLRISNRDNTKELVEYRSKFLKDLKKNIDLLQPLTKFDQGLIQSEFLTFQQTLKLRSETYELYEKDPKMKNKKINASLILKDFDDFLVKNNVKSSFHALLVQYFEYRS